MTLASQANDPQRIAEALLGLGGIAADLQEDLAAAEAHFARSLALREETGDRWGAALMRLNLADIFTARGDKASARSLIETGLASWRTLGYRQGIGRALYMLAQLDEERGDTAAAFPRYQECLTVWREVGYRAGIAEAATILGWLTLRGGDQGRQHPSLPRVSLFGARLGAGRDRLVAGSVPRSLRLATRWRWPSVSLARPQRCAKLSEPAHPHWSVPGSTPGSPARQSLGVAMAGRPGGRQGEPLSSTGPSRKRTTPCRPPRFSLRHRYAGVAASSA